MGKNITFVDKDEELIKRITVFQKKNDLPSFVEAVRRLCDVGLAFEKTVKKIK